MKFGISVTGEGGDTAKLEAAFARLVEDVKAAGATDIGGGISASEPHPEVEGLDETILSVNVSDLPTV